MNDYLKIRYGTQQEKEQIIRDWIANGYRLAGEDNIREGNFVVLAKPDMELELIRMTKVLIDKGVITTADISTYMRGKMK